MLFREIISDYLLELLLIAISAYVAVKTYGTRNSSGVTKAFSAFAAANAIFQILDLGMELNRAGVCLNGFAAGAVLYVTTLTAMACAGYHWFIYVEEAIGSKTVASKKKRLLWGVPLAVFFLLCAASVKTGWIFTFDAEGKYVIGSLFIVQYVVIFGYCLLAMARSAINFFVRKEKRVMDRTLLLIMLVDTAAVAVQLSFMVNMMNTALVLTVLLGYVTVYASELERVRSNLAEERRTIRKQESESKALAENNARLFALEDDFLSLYDVELESGSYVSFERNAFYKRNVSDKVVSQTEFFRDLRTNVDRVVFAEDREATFAVQQKDAIRRALAEKDHVDHHYRVITERGPLWLKMRIVYKDASKTNVIIGVFNAEEEMAQRQRDEAFHGELAQTNARLFALEDNFESLYEVEVESGNYLSFVKGDFYQNNVTDKLVSPTDYFEDLKANVDAVIYEADREGLIKALSRESIRGELAKSDHFDYYYRLKAGESPVWFKLRVVWKDAEKKRVIVGVFNAAEEMALKEKEERDRRALLSRMAGDDGVLLVDCVNDTKQVLHDYTHGEEDFYDAPSYTGTIRRYVAKYVAETDREMMLRETGPERVLARARNEREYTVRYKETLSGEPRYFEMRVSAFSDTEVIQSFRNVEEAVRIERAQKAISGDYFAIYLADLDADVIKVVKRSPAFRGDSARAENSYSSAIGAFVSGLGEADRLKWRGLDTADGVRAFLADQSKRELLYESAYAGGLARATWFVLDRTDGQIRYVCLAFSRLDEEEADREKLNEQLAVQREALRESLAFTNYFLDTYVSAYYVDLKNLSCQVYKRTEELEKSYPIVRDYFTSVTEYVHADVHPDDREDLLEIVQPERMRALLRERPEYSHIFRDVSGGVEKTYRMQVIRGADEDHAAFGFIDITREVNEQRRRQEEEEESRKLIDSIASTYQIAYDVNLRTDRFRLLRMDPSIIGADETFDTFSEAIDYFIHLLPVCDREKMRRELAYDTIREKLREKASYSVEYRVPLSGAMIWHEMNVTAIDTASDRVAVSFARRDLEITQKHLEDKRYGEYFALYEIDLDSGMMKIVKDSPYYGLDRSGTAMPFSPAMMRFAAGLDDEPRKFFERFADLDYARERFAEEDKLTYAYRSNNVNEKGWVDCTCYVTLRHDDGTPAMFTFGFSLIDSLGIYRQELQQKYVEQNEELIAQRTQLEEARNAAEAANAAKTDFLFSMSHDIRTPMNAIMGFTGMAIKHIDDRDKALDCLEKTQKAGGMLLSLINSVLEVSRIESGHATLEEQPGDILFSFANIENTMGEMADTKDIRLSFSFGEIRDRFVYADFSRCMRVFVNVISNAIKYTPEGGRVDVRCEEACPAKDGIGTYRYTVTDNGIGMSEEYQKHIFEQFSREQTSTVSGVQGSGLGMSVVKSFVDLMGGTVAVRSKQGEGSEITILLPFRLQTGEEYTDPVTGDVITPGTKKQRAEEISFTGRRVLLVEDNELNREIALEILEEEGLVVEDVGDGAAAVETLKEKGPDAYDFILMDIQMPVMNGYEATKAIREAYPDRHVPIIALSANAFAEDRQKSLDAGMDDHVAKPINVRELFGVLAKHLK